MMNRLFKARVGFFFNIAMIFAAASCSSDKAPTSSEEPRENYAIIETFAGTGEAGRGADGLPPLQTMLYLPQDLTFSPDDTPYILDWNNHRVCIVDGDAVRTLIGTGELGDAPAGQALEIGLNHPTHVAFDPQGRLILSAWHNSKILRMDLTTGVIVPICGDGTRSFRGDGGPVEDAWVNLPSATAFDASGLMYISDQANQRIRVVDNNGIISTYAGNGTSGFSGDGGPATEAQIFSPVGQAAQPASRIALDKNGNLYLADTANNRVRVIDTNGIIRTVAGNGEQGYSGDGGLATQASMNWPTDVALDSEGNLFIADTFNSCIRKVDKNGIITTFAGQCDEPGFEGDGSHPTKAKLARPYGVAFDGQDNLYIADTHNHRIRIIHK